MFRDSEDAISRQTLLCKYGGNALQLDQNNESIVSKLQSLIIALRHEMWTFLLLQVCSEYTAKHEDEEMRKVTLNIVRTNE